MIIPDLITTRMTWAITEEGGYRKLLTRILNQLYPGNTWQRHAHRDDEWSGPGVYRLQVRLNRPEGKPLYSLKWEGL